jgi:hypothetical protein
LGNSRNVEHKETLANYIVAPHTKHIFIGGTSKWWTSGFQFQAFSAAETSVFAVFTKTKPKISE